MKNDPRRKIKVLTDGLTLTTDGLAKFGHKELRAWVGSSTLLDQGVRYLNYNIDYITQYKAKVLSGQTVAYGYWHAQFRETQDHFLEAFEQNEDWTEYDFGVRRTLTYFSEQLLLCKSVGARVEPPHSYSMAMVSLDFFDSPSYEAVRYPTRGQTSGWFITTPSYNDDVMTLRPFHLYHLSAKRPELAKFMGLPYGYRFSWNRGEETVAFDVSVSREDPSLLS